jgi:hypothetical protein
MLSAMIAVLSTVYQTHLAIRATDAQEKVKLQTDVLKLWTILGIFIPFHFYFEAVTSLIPFSSVIFFLPQVLFPVLYVWLCLPFFEASPYVFERLRPIVKTRVLPVVHALLVRVCLWLMGFFLHNFISIIPRETLDALQSQLKDAKKTLIQASP